MRRQSRSWLSYFSFFLGMAVTVLATSWLMPFLAGDENRAYGTLEQRYVLQITSLKEALSQSQRTVEHERRLAIGLQRELQDAVRQIDELNRDITELRALKARAEDKVPAGGEKRASLATAGSVVLTYAAKQIRLEQNREHAARPAQVSPYAPQRRQVRATDIQDVQRVIVRPLNGAANQAAPRFHRDARVAALRSRERVAEGSGASGRVFEQSAALQERESAVSLQRARERAGELQSEQLRRLRIAEARRERAVQAARARTRSARFRPRQRLGRLNARPRRTTRQRQRRGSVFSRMARRGVFGDGYSSH